MILLYTKSCNKTFIKSFLEGRDSMKKLSIASALLSDLAVSGAANAYQAEVGGS